MTTGSKILVSVAAAVSAGVIINSLLRTEKGKEVGKQLHDVAGSVLEKGKEMLNKAKHDAHNRINEKLV